MKKGDILELDITGYGYEGKGISRIPKSIIKPGSYSSKSAEDSNYVVLVDGSYPGDEYRCRLG